ncbi:MAG: bifunctional riboflavin kinase/FAD synthetase [Chloroflexi bacterium]|nr:bifunctional riboflavin kinase/FAD synthetase [Chloroflexota bacterium]
MQHVYRLADATPAAPTIVAIGVFDGVHRGHQYLLRDLVTTANRQGCVPTVLTFFPHPDVVLGKAEARIYLSSPEERAALLGELGVELVVTHPFDEEVRQIRAADFVDGLVHYLRVREVWVGADFALGYKREGNVDFLRAQGEHKGFKLEVIELLTNENSGRIISSNGIRAALDRGDIEQVNRWLGRPFKLAGEIVRGDGRGRKIGFPTANMDIWHEQMLPARGVYAGWAHLGEKRYMAVANVGRRPTFRGRVVRVEVHLLDFDRDIYGETLTFEFITRLRQETRFENVEALVAQIHRDVARGREVLEEQSP